MRDDNKPIRLLMVDDHQLVRQGIHALLRAAPDIEVVGEARDGKEAIALTQQLNPDLILMDIEMPLMDGVDATRLIVNSNCGAKVLILTMREDGAEVRRALQAGAHGFQSKNSDRNELIQGIRAVYRGERWISPSVARFLAPNV